MRDARSRPEGSGARRPAAPGPQDKPTRRSSQPEQELLRWIRACDIFQMPIVTGSTIRGKATKLHEEIMESAAPATADVLNALVFSNRWLCEFQSRHKLTSKRTDGEAASVKAAAVTDGRIAFQDGTKESEPTVCNCCCLHRCRFSVRALGYAKRNIFNMDEMAYFYCTPPDKTISMKRISGRKNAKKRLTVTVTCNADRSTKLPLLFVGSAMKPRCFGGKTGAELGFEYENTPKA